MIERDNEYGTDPLEFSPGSGNGGSIIQQIAAVLGVIIIIFGLVLGVYIFAIVYEMVKQPAAMTTMVDQMELVVTGQQPPSELFTGSADVATTATVSASQHMVAGNIVHGGIPLRTVQRGFAIGLYFMLLALLLRIAVAIIGAGANLSKLATPYKTIYEKTLKDILVRVGLENNSSRHRRKKSQ